MDGARKATHRTHPGRAHPGRAHCPAKRRIVAITPAVIISKDIKHLIGPVGNLAVHSGNKDWAVSARSAGARTSPVKLAKK